MHMHLVTISPSLSRATAAAGAATLGAAAAAAAINRGGSRTVTAAATVAREVASATARVVFDTQAENGAVTWWAAADLDSGYRVQQFWQKLED